MRLLFRTDGNSVVGLGHLYRSYALARMLGYRFCKFLVESTSKEYADKIFDPANVVVLDRGKSTSSGELIASYCELYNTNTIIIDSYEISEKLRRNLFELGYNIIVIDDFLRPVRFCHLVINHSRKGETKNREFSGRFDLFGAEYVILRAGFLAYSRIRYAQNRVERSILVAIGSTDPYNISKMIVGHIAKLRVADRVIILSGLSERQVSSKYAYINKIDLQIEVKYGLTEPNLIKLFSKVEFAICTSSTVALELVATRCPIIIGTIAGNQKLLHRQIEDSGSAIAVGGWKNISKRRLQIAIEKLRSCKSQIVLQQMKFIDGMSGSRIKDVIANIGSDD